MDIEEIRAPQKGLVLAKPAEVDTLESQLWITFPSRYREYITTLGEGILGGTLVRIYPPWRIRDGLADWRRRIDKHWFWDKGRKLLPKERALECVIIGDTMNGDELVFHPTRTDHLFVLPIDDERIFDVGGDLLGAIDWMCSSGKLVKPFAERNFEPFDSRKQVTKRGANDSNADDPKGESLGDLVRVAGAWASRHSLRAKAQRAARKEIGKDRKATLSHEAIVFEGEFPFGPGYHAVFQITEKVRDVETGIFTWHQTEEAEFSRFDPARKKGR